MGLSPCTVFILQMQFGMLYVFEANEGRVTSEADHLLHFVWVWVVTPIVIP
jgi:hypothetical protein